MPNYGLMNQMVNGIREGLLAYQTVKQIKRQEKMDNLMKGIQENPDTGDLEYTPEMKEQKRVEGLLKKQQLAEYEPGSAAKALTGLLGEGSVPETMSLREAKELAPFYTTKMRQREESELDKAYKQAKISNLLKPTPQKPEPMPLENKITISNLSQKNANKISIANQIDAVMDTWDSLSDDQKIVQGRQLLKTLNSTEGADAIGAEEAKRLGGFLEYKILNVSEPGPKFGRALKEFKEQASATSKNIKSAIQANKRIIQELSGESEKKGLIQKEPEKKSKPEWAL